MQTWVAHNEGANFWARQRRALRLYKPRTHDWSRFPRGHRGVCGGVV